MKRLEDIVLLIEDRLIEKMAKLLEEKGAMAGNITRAELRKTMEEVYESGRRDEARRPRAVLPAADEDPAAEPDERAMLHTWNDGSMHRLPQEYILTCWGNVNTGYGNQRQTAQQSYLRWNTPDRQARICAIRYCHASDFFHKNQRKRFSDWKK